MWQAVAWLWQLGVVLSLHSSGLDSRIFPVVNKVTLRQILLPTISVSFVLNFPSVLYAHPFVRLSFFLSLTSYT